MAGGAAINAGIDFQHRVAALVMTTMLTDLADLAALGLIGGSHTVREIRCETDDRVDDIVLVTDGPLVLVQAKRSLSLSTVSGSEFSKATRQFVKQYLVRPTGDDVLVLATTPRASSRIRYDLFKLSEAARLNELGPGANPLTKAEIQTLADFRAVLDRHVVDLAGRHVTDDEVLAVLRRLRVAVLDIEDGGSLHHAVLAMLGARTAIAPGLVWTAMTALALNLAKSRLSIDASALTDRLGRYFTPTANTTALLTSEENLLEIVVAEQLRCGREVVLAWDGEHLLLCELIRFDDDGSRRVRFIDGKVQLGSGDRWDVLLRTATMAGMERLLLEDPSIVEGRELFVIPINSDEDFDASPWAVAHAEALRSAIEVSGARARLLDCLRCGRPISDSKAQVVEVDEEGLAHEVGLIHRSCLRPTHRVLGQLQGELIEGVPELTNFDYRSWVRARPRGQGMVSALPAAWRSRVLVIGWKPGRANLAVGDWGVAYALEDGSERYVTERGRVVRMTREQATEQAARYNEETEQAKGRNDPWMVSERSGTFAPYSTLVTSEPGSRLLAVGVAAPRELTRAKLRAHNTVDNYYAPMLFSSTAQPARRSSSAAQSCY